MSDLLYAPRELSYVEKIGEADLFTIDAFLRVVYLFDVCTSKDWSHTITVAEQYVYDEIL